MAGLLRRALLDPAVPAAAKDVRNWPELAQHEWGSDEGRTAAATHRAHLVAGFEHVRAVIDDFDPDLVLIWGDDQYENFKEDLIPPFAVLAYPDLRVQPWADATAALNMKGRPNIWDEPADTSFIVRGRPDIGKFLVNELLERSIDMSYAYKPLHHAGLAHAFMNAVLYLDYHRKGFDYPVLSFPINCYGRRVISYEGFASAIDDNRELDPVSPSPSRLMDLGAAVGEIFVQSPYRVALVASSSWSHAFLCDHTWRLRPDTARDRALYEAMLNGSTQTWRNCTLDEIEVAGQQELLNWYPLMGAMEALGQRTPEWSTFVETGVFNSNKVFATYRVAP
jgi:hypothetical protein